MDFTLDCRSETRYSGNHKRIFYNEILNKAFSFYSPS